MELNIEIKRILKDYSDLCKSENWNESEKEIRAIYDTFRIQNILKKLK